MRPISVAVVLYLCLHMMPLMIHALPQGSVSLQSALLKSEVSSKVLDPLSSHMLRLRGGRHLTKGFWRDKKAELKTQKERAASLASEAVAMAKELKSVTELPSSLSASPAPKQSNSPIAQGLVMATCLFSIFYPLAKGGFNAENTDMVLWVVAGLGSAIFSLFFLGQAIGVDLVKNQRANTIRCLALNMFIEIIVGLHAHFNLPAAFPFLQRLENPVIRTQAVVGAASIFVLMLSEADRPSDLTWAEESLVSKFTTFLATSGVWFTYWFGASFPLYRQYKEGKELSPWYLPFGVVYSLMGLYFYIINPASKIAPCTSASDFGPADE